MDEVLVRFRDLGLSEQSELLEVIDEASNSHSDAAPLVASTVAPGGKRTGLAEIVLAAPSIATAAYVIARSLRLFGRGVEIRWDADLESWTTRRSPDLPRGSIAVFDSEGKVTVTNVDDLDVQGRSAAIVKALTKGE